MMNYAWDFCQSEMEKYFEWIIIHIARSVWKQKQHRNYTMLYLLQELLFIVTFLSRQLFNQKDFELLNTTEFYAHS